MTPSIRPGVWLPGSFAAARSKSASALPVPSFVGVGAMSKAPGPSTVALPGSLATNDYLFLFVVTDPSTPLTITNQNGGSWAERADSPITGASAGLYLRTFQSRYNGTQGNPTLSNYPNGNTGGMACIAAVRGANLIGDPVEAIATGFQNTQVDVAGLPAVTTLGANRLVMGIVGIERDLTDLTANWVTATGGNLTNFNERVDDFHNGSLPHAMWLGSGDLAAAGSSGTINVTPANICRKAFATLAVKP